MLHRLKPYYQDILLFIAAFAVFAASLANGFVGDDVVYFIGNKSLISFDIHNILMSGAIEVDYCPLRDISLAIDYLVWGQNPFGFHLTNVVLYGCSVVMIRHLFVKLLCITVGRDNAGVSPKNPAGPFLAALLFAVHPVHGEVVYAVNNRGIILAGLFVTLSCIFYLNYLHAEEKGGGSYAGSLICFVAAILSKEYSIILPLLLVFFIIMHGKAYRTPRLLGIIPFVLVSGVFYYVFKSIAVAARFISPVSESIFSDFFSKILVALEIIVYYLFRLVRAEGLIPLFLGNSSPSQFVLIVLTLTVIALIALSTILLRHKLPQLYAGFTFYVVCLIPVLNFFRTHDVTADRFVYIPSIGLFFIISSASFQRWKVQTLVMSTILLITWTVLSIQDTVHWKDNVVFWEHVANVNPSLNSFSNLGLVYEGANQPQKAREAFLKALQYVSESPGEASKGDILLKLGDNEGAINAYETVLARFRNSKKYSYYVVSWQLYNNLSKAYMNTGNYPEALKALENSIRLKPDRAGLYNSLGVLQGEMKQYDLAIRAFEKAMALDPSYGNAPLNLVRIYSEMGDKSRAEKYLMIVKTRFPDMWAEVDQIEKNIHW